VDKENWASMLDQASADSFDRIVLDGYSDEIDDQKFQALAYDFRNARTALHQYVYKLALKLDLEQEAGCAGISPLEGRGFLAGHRIKAEAWCSLHSISFIQHAAIPPLSFS
jgi:hypothetical protein